MAESEHGTKRQQTLFSADAKAKKQRCQQKHRRSKTLIRKAYELSTKVEADVFLGIRDRATGKIKTFCADKTDIWSSHMSHLVRPSLYWLLHVLQAEYIGLLLPHPRPKNARGLFIPKAIQHRYLDKKEHA